MCRFNFVSTAVGYSHHACNLSPVVRCDLVTSVLPQSPSPFYLSLLSAHWTPVTFVRRALIYLWWSKFEPARTGHSSSSWGSRPRHWSEILSLSLLHLTNPVDRLQWRQKSVTFLVSLYQRQSHPCSPLCSGSDNKAGFHRRSLLDKWIDKSLLSEFEK